uniref:ORF7 n=1 Tax=Carrot yellow leaf virus TaxID=656190 RepID=A0A0A0P6W8_9CLOS|nr:ORF7 [Carrot yellow leaf virus]AHA85443.1 ORF7 [Carrot yellow leaf virus]AHA85484.1 ORF7 [Carrot yellow leaf virus]AHA85514.1 ORF7 [Carrot yellow leaf virus]AHA85524.1 ORF7 [Carrot yellow leaf virus]
MSKELMIVSPDGSLEKADVSKLAIATRESMQAAFSALDLSSVSGTSDSCLSDSELTEAATKVNTELKKITKGEDIDMPSHFAALIARAATIGTSLSAVYRNQQTYSIRGKGKYTVKDAEIFPYIIDVTAKYGKPNGLRAFFASLENAFLVIAKMKPQLFESRVATRRGTPKEKGYLATDFLSGASPILVDQERAILNSASSYALDRAASKKKNSGLVSLYDYGRYD